MLKKIWQMEHKHQVFFALLISIGLVSFWRGTWGLLDLFVLPENPAISFLISIAFGIFILFLTGHLTEAMEKGK